MLPPGWFLYFNNNPGIILQYPKADREKKLAKRRETWVSNSNGFQGVHQDNNDQQGLAARRPA
jgi:hypothetical protein